MNEKIKAHLTAYAESKGWSTGDDELMEILDDSNTLYREMVSGHRWYDVYFVVVEVNGLRIGFSKYYTTGDDSWRDMGLGWNYDSVTEVEPYEVTVIKYRPCQN